LANALQNVRSNSARSGGKRNEKGHGGGDSKTGKKKNLGLGRGFAKKVWQLPGQLGKWRDHKNRVFKEGLGGVE